MKSPVYPTLAFALLLAVPALHAAERSEVITLPEYSVRTDRMLPSPESWHHARIQSFEVLSSVSERETRRVIQEIGDLHEAMKVVWPGIQQLLPRESLLIICGGNQFNKFLPTNLVSAPRATLSLRDADNAALVIDHGTGSVSLFGHLGDPVKMDTSVFDFGFVPVSASLATPEISRVDDRFAGTLPNGLSPLGPEFSFGNEQAFLGAGGLAAPFTVVAPEISVDHRGQRQREYIRFLFAQFPQRLPAWLDEGLARLFMMMEVTPDFIRFAAPRYDPDDVVFAAPEIATEGGEVRYMGPTIVQVGEKEFNTVLASRGLLPMQEFFAVQHDAAATRDVVVGLWAHQAAAFVHWGLYGQDGANRKAFLAFVDRATREPVTEAVVKECFDTNFTGLGRQLRAHIRVATYQEVNFIAREKKFAMKDPIVIRDATQAEVGRIKGVAFRLAGHADRAHTELATAYARGERDPQLLAELGIQERTSGNTDRANRLLTAATQAKVAHARAYLELARLRFAQAEAKPAGANGKFDAAQTAGILRPLFEGRNQTPPRSEIYNLIADTWSRSAIAPTRDNLAVLQEGIVRFPYNFKLLYQTAELYTANNFHAEAAPLIRLGLKFQNPGFRGRFEKLHASVNTGR